MGFDKLAAPLAGLAVLRRTLAAFLAVDAITEIIVVGPAERWKLLGGINFSKPVHRVDGGLTRQDSVAAGLAEVSGTYVAVHDGARPLIAPAEILRCVEAAIHHSAVALARRVTETLKRSDAEDYGVASISREHLWLMETPQVFKTMLLREAYTKLTTARMMVTDEVTALETLGMKVKFIESHYPNIKITTPADLALAEAYLA